MAFLGPMLSALVGWLLRALGVAVGSTLIGVLGILFSDVILSLIGKVIDLLGSSVSSVGITLPTVNTTMGALPPQMLDIMKRIRLDDALSMIVTAVGIRGAATAFSAIRTLRRGAGH